MARVICLYWITGGATLLFLVNPAVLLADDEVVNVPEPPAQAGCPSPTLANGRVLLIPRGTARIYPGDMANLQCDKGFQLTLNDFPYSYSYIRCSNNLQWITPHGFTSLPTCQENVCPPPPVIPFAEIDVRSESGGVSKYTYESRAYYLCNSGYFFDDPGVFFLTCRNGQWVGPKPVCRPAACPKPPPVANSTCTLFTTSVACHEHDMFENGVQIYYNCEVGFRLTGSAVRKCKGQEWTGVRPRCWPVGCSEPPLLDHGDRNIHSPVAAAGRLPENSKAEYFCLSGYRFEDEENASVEIICRNGQWTGPIPRCRKRLNCDMPQNIPHGNWVILGPESKFSVGMKVMYECQSGYSAYGKTELECLASGFWSDNPPKCFPIGTYCTDPGKLENGFYMCQPHHCSMFEVGTEISYMCDNGYEPLGDIRQRCLKGSRWSGSKPVCLPVNTTPRLDPSPAGSPGTVTAVIVTSCSVLGLLLLIMIIVALQRRKKSPRLCHPVQPPPPPAYPRPRTDSLDEHDRVALIACADGVQVVLPSYEEATRGRAGSSGPSRFHSDGSASSSVRRGDYRPLPTIPASLRGSGRLDSPRATAAALAGHPDHHRNSIVTTASAARDNISLAFGSMDTMNISDGTSTSVTIETFDSGASNPSLALSQRAATGSLGSSNGSLANEDAPLLDNISESGRTTHPPRTQPEHSTGDELKPE